MNRINVSLDALNNEIFSKMNGGKAKSEEIVRGIEEAVAQGLAVKVNMVVKGINESEILPMARFFEEKGMTIRFIEYMDVETLNGWKMDEVLTSKEVHDMIHQEIPLKPVQSTFLARFLKGIDTEVRMWKAVLFLPYQELFVLIARECAYQLTVKSIHAICLKRR
ncbi:molybdenum cofactor biosynthesis enzyme MoaA [Aeribacillus sp. SP014]|jgi:cyclic pyranopterin phosphate synthase